jgi:hypothetical protein
MPLEPGTRLGPYEILEPLGQGGMADVYRAHDSRLGRQVAIKVATEQFTDRFAREARAVAALNHPNLCTLYDVGPDYLVMEVVDGPTLGEHLARSGPLSAGVATARNCSMWRPIDRSSPSTSARLRASGRAAATIHRAGRVRQSRCHWITRPRTVGGHARWPAVPVRRADRSGRADAVHRGVELAGGAEALTA